MKQDFGDAEGAQKSRQRHQEARAGLRGWGMTTGRFVRAEGVIERLGACLGKVSSPHGHGRSNALFECAPGPARRLAKHFSKHNDPFEWSRAQVNGRARARHAGEEHSVQPARAKPYFSRLLDHTL